MGYIADSHVNARYERLASLARNLSGQACDARKAFLLEVRLKPVMDLLGVGSVDDLLERVSPDVPSNLESYFADALVDGETWFFRERQSLQLVADDVAARLSAGKGPVSIWCAGGSSGQESYSLAILLDELMPGLEPDAARIVSSDIGLRVTKRAEAATYSHFEIQMGLSADRMITHFSRFGDRDWQASERLRARVDFRQHNLLDGALMPDGFDVVVCRNVLSSMTAPHRAKALASLGDGMKPGAMLLLDPCETLESAEGFEPAGAVGQGLFRLA